MPLNPECPKHLCDIDGNYTFQSLKFEEFIMRWAFLDGKCFGFLQKIPFGQLSTDKLT